MGRPGRPRKVRSFPHFSGEKKFLAGVKPGVYKQHANGEQVLTGQPFYSTAICGVSFQDRTKQLVPIPGTGGRELGLDGGQDGGVVSLTHEQVESIIANAAGRRVSWNANKTSASVFHVDATRPVRRNGEWTAGPLARRVGPRDEPIGRHIYLVPLEEVEKLGGRSAENIPCLDEYLKQFQESSTS